MSITSVVKQLSPTSNNNHCFHQGCWEFLHLLLTKTFILMFCRSLEHFTYKSMHIFQNIINFAYTEKIHVVKDKVVQERKWILNHMLDLNI